MANFWTENYISFFSWAGLDNRRLTFQIFVRIFCSSSKILLNGNDDEIKSFLLICLVCRNIWMAKWHLFIIRRSSRLCKYFFKNYLYAYISLYQSNTISINLHFLVLCTIIISSVFCKWVVHDNLSWV